MKKITSFSEILALTVVVLSFAYFFCISFIASANTQNTGEIKIGLLGCVSTILAFHFGSSQGSKNKDKVIEDALNKNPPIS